jgi:hypothetical protein
MKKIKLGSLCTTKIDKNFEYNNKICTIKEGSFALVCDDDSVDKGWVLVELEGFDDVFGYKLDELTLVENY